MTKIFNERWTLSHEHFRAPCWPREWKVARELKCKPTIVHDWRVEWRKCFIERVHYAAARPWRNRCGSRSLTQRSPSIHKISGFPVTFPNLRAASERLCRVERSLVLGVPQLGSHDQTEGTWSSPRGAKRQMEQTEREIRLTITHAER